MFRQNIVALRTFRPSRTAFFLAVILLLLILLAPVATRVEGAADDLCFPETGRCTSALFSTYWWEHGGLAQQGYPLSDLIDEVSPVDGRAYRVQYFERARFEYHPENAAPNNVLLGLLGREQYQAKYPAGRPSGGTGDQCFPETGRCVRGVFFAYWQQHGALAQQGLPLSDEFDEVSPVDGRMYRVQYFERARFEYHPENAGTPYVALLGLLGHEQLLRQSPTAAAPAVTVVPTAAAPAVTVVPTVAPAAPFAAPAATVVPTVAPAAPFAAPAATVVPAATATPPIAPTATPTPTAGALDAEEAAFLALINDYRKQHGLGPLTVAATLTDAAAWLSADMAAKDYFAHTDSLGRDPFARMCAFGYCANAAKGENIAAGNATAQATFAQWQASTGHNANMLDPHYTVIGIGRAPGGPYGWYWTTDFGSAP